ncbi:CRISPR-associated endoribonuclease Cas6 [Kurthia sibirica]|uniref:CRISPR-associated endoribonuclease Cas6 n=1 Tax=Kurthia sibirica TaxID=202750 RepID=A0A2U3AIW8_9BACL|nr:CRISPR-associated endoribonuclease Cas6 [Kurthia sibirica]PWI24478.1 CRISPR-associated endoribonuclease Cas6 [Kurthia sibirica]GEK35341.1 hypothetical protein KSI01_28740 [Kurthia sibirica]
MRIVIQLNIKNIPQQYRMVLLAFVKEMIRKGDEVVYEELYGGEKKPKALTYSMYMKNFKLENGMYEMDGATFIFSTSDATIGVAFINGITSTKTFKHKGNVFNIQSISLANEANIQSSEVKFKILNALLIENSEGKPLLIEDHDFEKELNYIINQKFQYLYGRNLHSNIQIIDSQLKKIVVQETNRHADGRNLYYTGQKGTFTLRGHVEDLKLIYKDGIGLRSSSGWGTLEYVNERRRVHE